MEPDPITEDTLNKLSIGCNPPGSLPWRELRPQAVRKASRSDVPHLSSSCIPAAIHIFQNIAGLAVEQTAERLYVCP